MKKITLNLEKILSESLFPALVLDRENRIVLSNEAFLKFINKEREEVEGKFCYELIHGSKERPKFCPLEEGEVCLLSGCQNKDYVCSPCPLEECDKKASIEKSNFLYKEFFEPRLKKYLRVDLFTLYDEKGEIFGYLHFIEDKTETKNLIDLLKNVIETYPGFFFINDENFNLLYMNKNLQNLCKDKDAKCYEILYGETKPCEGCPLLKGNIMGEEEVYSPKLNRYFLRYFKTFKTPSGQILKITFYNDITEQVRLFEEASIPLVVVTWEGELLRANKRARELFGLSSENLRKYRASDFWEDPQERKAFLERLEREAKIVGLEIKLKRASGEPFYALISSSLFKENDLKLIYSAIEDITEYLKAKEEAKKFIERVLEFLPAGVAVIDERDRALFVNSKFSEITGYSKEELIGANLHQLLIADEELKERAKPIFEKIAKGHWPKLAKRRIEFQARKKSGDLFLAEVFFDEFYFEGKRLFIGVIQDITERKKIEEKLCKEEKEFVIEKIAGGLAHDLNNLLMIVKGYLDLLKKHLKEKELSYLEKIDLSFERMKQLVSELFILSRGEMKNIEWIEVSEFLKTWVPFFLRGSEIKLSLDLEEGLYLPMEGAHLLSIVQNLVLNAKEVMKNVGELRVKAYKTKDSLCLIFEDKGPGIPEEYWEKIFEAGFTTKPKGSGLGLYIVKRIVNLYGGSIEVKSSLGEGTTFILRFPLEGEERRPREEKEGFFPPERKEISKEKILILDDEEEIREVLREFLEEKGFEVETAENGDKALDLVIESKKQKNPFSIFLLDLTVPEGKGGLYFLRKLQALSEDLSKYKIILITGYTEKEVMNEAKDFKIDHILYKPFSLEALLEVISKAK
ncbi:MAG: PAS domain S-box protein [Caldimicrobium sp.]